MVDNKHSMYQPLALIRFLGQLGGIDGYNVWDKLYIDTTAEIIDDLRTGKLKILTIFIFIKKNKYMLRTCLLT